MLLDVGMLLLSLADCPVAPLLDGSHPMILIESASLQDRVLSDGVFHTIGTIATSLMPACCNCASSAAAMVDLPEPGTPAKAMIILSSGATDFRSDLIRSCSKSIVSNSGFLISMLQTAGSQRCNYRHKTMFSLLLSARRVGLSIAIPLCDAASAYTCAPKIGRVCSDACLSGRIRNVRRAAELAHLCLL